MVDRVLVPAGGAGFIGSHFVDGPMSKGFDVVVLDGLYCGSRENLSSRLDEPIFYDSKLIVCSLLTLQTLIAKHILDSKE